MIAIESERGRMMEFALYFLRLGFLGFAYPLLQPAWVMVR